MVSALNVIFDCCMSGSPKTRFSVIKGGEDRELFSVQERKSGDLLIFLKFAGMYEHVDGNKIAVSGQRYSVHCSPNSEGRTVKHTLDFSGNGKIDSAQFYLPGFDGFTALLFGKTVQNLAPKKYLLMKNNNDKIIKLCQFDIGIMTMFYFIIITDIDYEIKNYNSKMNVKILQFSKFNLVVLSGFFPVPALPEADIMHLCTSIPRFDPNDAPLYLEPPNPSFSFQYWLDFAESAVPKLADATLLRLQRFKFDEGNGLNEQSLEMARWALSFYVNTPMPVQANL